MRTFGRVLAGLGVGLAVVGSVGALAMLPQPVLHDAASYVEEHRQALRAHLPEMPPVGDLIAGTSAACAAPAAEISSDGSGAEENCAAPVEPEQVADDQLLTRSKKTASHFRAPAAPTPTPDATLHN